MIDIDWFFMGLSLGLVLGALIMRGIMRPTKTAESVAKEISDGLRDGSIVLDQNLPVNEQAYDKRLEDQ